MFSDQNWILSEDNRRTLENLFEAYKTQYEEGVESQAF